MKTKAKWLSVGILLVYVLMCLPWAMKVLSSREDGGYFVSYLWMSYSFGLFLGNPFSFASALLAFAALIVSLFISFGHKRCATACGILLFASASAVLAMGIIVGFHCFTSLTYGIIAALIGLGFFALFGFLGIRQNDKTERVQSYDV